MNINFFKGSGAVNGINECVFLIAKTNSIGDIDSKSSGWFRAVSGWEALDEACGEFTNCVIVKSAIAKEYDNYCESNQ